MEFSQQDTASGSDCDSGPETDREDQPGPSKIPKITKTKGASKYRTKFNKAWIATFPFIREVPGDAHSFHCTICGRNSSCGHMGRHDIERHTGLSMHKANVKAARSQSTLSFRPTSSPLAEQTTRAEVKVAAMLVQHNVPLAVADELTPLFRDVFPDSKIAQNFSSQRTKTACMINGAIAPFFQRALVQSMQLSPFALAIDGSNDNTSTEKMNPLTVRLFDQECGVVRTQFLDMCLSSSASAEGIFSRMDEALSSHHIGWENCIGMGLDNTSVNMGCRNSIKTRVLQKNSSVYMMGCPCHIIHNTAEKAGVALSRVSGLQVEELLVDLFFWFDKSTKRKASLVEYCTFCDTEYRQIIKHVNTRWLSLERAVQRVLQQFDPLKSYFLSEDEDAPRFQRLQSSFGKPMTEVYLLFVQSALQIFIRFNKFLQSEFPLVPVLYRQMELFVKKLLSKFLQVSTIKDAKGDFSVLGYKESENQLSDNQLFVGLTTKMKLRKLLDDGDISPHEASTFHRGVRAFYERAVEYSLANLPLKDELLINAAFVDFSSRESANFAQVEYFVQRYSTVLPYQSPQELDLLQEEFLEYQLLNSTDIPQYVWEKATVVEDEESRYHRMDIVWHYIASMKMPDSALRFPRLSRIALLVLTIPHSNAEEERLFSMVRKNKTAFRSSLDPRGTLSSIMTVKLAQTEPAHKFEPPKELLKKAKAATWEYNKEHSSSSKK